VVLVPSKRSKELLMHETKLFPEPIVYYNGIMRKHIRPSINSELFNTILKINRDKFIIAIVSRLEIQKRVDRAVEIARSLILKKMNIHLLIFGDGELEQNLQSLVNNFKLTESIQFLGYVENLFNYYKLFDIILFTSEWEGMPLAMWEALVNKVPVVAPDVGGFKEILEENNCGLIYKPADLNDAEEKILKIINDEQFKKYLGENGKIAVEKKYNEKKFITEIERVYLSLL
jgi:glycosyltransferase involved in cell wall biosynthesis